MTVFAPEPLTDRHDINAFDSGVETLDAWLKRRALKNQISGASRTFVACNEHRVMAYYALASGAITVGHAAGRFGRNMPDPIPRGCSWAACRRSIIAGQRRRTSVGT